MEALIALTLKFQILEANINAFLSNPLYGASPNEIRPDNYAIKLCIKY